jgi:ElaA protein
MDTKTDYTPTIHWEVLAFSALTPQQLYEILQLRNEVFVVEQNCVFQDADGKDPESLHLMGRDESGKLIAYTRLLPKGLAYPDYASIGRVVTSPAARRIGLGTPLMKKSIEILYQLFGEQDIKIGAQAYLIHFYTSLGFRDIGKPYLEDGIPHLEMILEK